MLILIILCFLLGYKFSTLKPLPELTQDELNLIHIPKFKVGDCIKLQEYIGQDDIYEYGIIEILKNKDYGYSIGIKCPEDDIFCQFSYSAAPSIIMDKKAIKIPCPKYDN